MQHDLCNGWGVEWRRLVSLVWHFGQQYRTWLVGQTSFLRLHLQLLVHGVHCRRPYDSQRQTSSKSRRSGPSCWLPKSLRGQGPANSAAAGSRIDVPPLAAAGPGDGKKTSGYKSVLNCSITPLAIEKSKMLVVRDGAKSQGDDRFVVHGLKKRERLSRSWRRGPIRTWYACSFALKQASGQPWSEQICSNIKRPAFAHHTVWMNFIEF